MDDTGAYGRVTPGVSLVAIGVIHQAVGVALGRGELIALWRAGVVDQAEANPMRMALVWFLLFGFALIFAGWVTHRLEVSGGRFSRGLALGLGALCATGVLLMPASGFWLGFIPAVQIWRRATL
ncbi:MAG: hypothetical protein FJW30_04110 [Acidobacteria bacterium]|nr:hypothetical protein [Acidobacteriota bacterium]